MEGEGDSLIIKMCFKQTHNPLSNITHTQIKKGRLVNTIIKYALRSIRSILQYFYQKQAYFYLV